MKNLINLAFEGELLNLINMDHFVSMDWETTFATGEPRLILIMSSGRYVVPDEHQHTVVAWLESQGYTISEPKP